MNAIETININGVEYVRADSVKVPKKQIKLLCWTTGTFMVWATEYPKMLVDEWIRVPANDKVIEVEE